MVILPEVAENAQSLEMGDIYFSCLHSYEVTRTMVVITFRK